MPRYHFFGKTVSLCERIEQAANPGEVHMSSRTEALVRQVFSSERRGEVEFAGTKVDHFQVIKRLVLPVPNNVGTIEE